MIYSLPVTVAGLDMMSLGLIHIMIPHQSWGQTRADKSHGRRPGDPHNRDLSHRHAEACDVIVSSVQPPAVRAPLLHSGFGPCLLQPAEAWTPRVWALPAPNHFFVCGVRTGHESHK